MPGIFVDSESVNDFVCTRERKAAMLKVVFVIF